MTIIYIIANLMQKLLESKGVKMLYAVVLEFEKLYWGPLYSVILLNYFLTNFALYNSLLAVRVIMYMPRSNEEMLMLNL